MKCVRKSVSKKIRFEVLKRDSFKCQYCGSSAPNVVLNVDHINPVSKGGSNEIFNLITACWGCNSGKSDRVLDDNSVITKQKEQLDSLNAKNEQLKMMSNWRNDLKQLEERTIAIIIHEINSHYEDGGLLNRFGEDKIKKWTKKYTLEVILKSVDISANQYLKNCSDENDVFFNMIPRIANKIKNGENDDFHKEAYYVRAILKNRFNYTEWKSIDWIKKAKKQGFSHQKLCNIAKNTNNWESFEDWMDKNIEGGVYD